MFKGPGPTELPLTPRNRNKIRSHEVLKDEFSTALGRLLAYQYRGQIYVVAAGCAEACAPFMCPFEMLKVRVQTLRKGRSSHSSARRLSPYDCQPTEFAISIRFVGATLSQTPSTIANFIVFERVVEFPYTRILTKVGCVRRVDPTRCHVCVGIYRGLCQFRGESSGRSARESSWPSLRTVNP
jgi:hypothetical protein